LRDWAENKNNTNKRVNHRVHREHRERNIAIKLKCDLDSNNEKHTFFT
jgi:hypothetical protein